MAEHIFIAQIPGTDNDKLRKIVCNIIHHIVDQIKSLLVRQTGNQANHILLLVFDKAQFLLQSGFIDRFFLTEIVFVVIGIYFRIGLRIVHAIVNAVYNPLHIKMPCGK